MALDFVEAPDARSRLGPFEEFFRNVKDDIVKAAVSRGLEQLRKTQLGQEAEVQARQEVVKSYFQQYGIITIVILVLLIVAGGFVRR